MCLQGGKIKWPCFLCRLYREWEELQGSIMADRGRQLSAEEGALLKDKGHAALDALLQIVNDRVLDFVAPGAPAEQVQELPMSIHPLAPFQRFICLEANKMLKAV